MNVVKIKQTTFTKFSVIKRGTSLSQIASGGAESDVLESICLVALDPLCPLLCPPLQA